MKKSLATLGPAKHHFRVAIFGSARIASNDKLWQEIYKLAKMLAAEGKDLVTGGGPGLMEAASSGHFEGDSEQKFFSIGLQISLPREQREAKHLDIKKQFAQFSSRLDEFMRLADAVVVAPGGVGTLLELTYAWQLVQVNKIKKIPIILMGEMWEDFFAWIKSGPLKHHYLEEQELDLLHLVKTPEEAMEIIRQASNNKKPRKIK